MIITDKYIIKESRVFFTYQDYPYDKGILDMEDLLEFSDKEDFIQKRFDKGPYQISNSDFMCVLIVGNCHSHPKFK